MKNFIYTCTLGLVILTVVLMPGFGAIDVIGFQWFYLAIANFIVVFANLLFLRNKAEEIYFRLLSKSKMLHFFCFFLLFALISFFSSKNIPSSIIGFSEIIILFISTFNFLFFFVLLNDSNQGYRLLFSLIIVIISGELLISYREIFSDLFTDGILNTGSVRYSGYTGNVNILSYSILVKIPLLFYAISNLKGKLLKSIIAFFYLLSVGLIFSLETRSAFYLLILITFFLFIFSLHKKKYRLAIFLPLVLLISLGFVRYFSANPNSRFVGELSNVVSTEDSSFNQRKIIYSISLEMLSDHPLIGVGIGNWKTESIKYYKDYLEGYIVPYHSHNDFLQIAAEIGVFGLISFLLIMYYPVFYLFKKLNSLNIILLLSIAIHSIDSLINFPIARPVNILPILLILAYLYFKIDKEKICIE